MPALHPGQMAAWREFHRPKLKRLDLVCGTKWGKTLFAGVLMGADAWGGRVGRRTWAAPVYRQSLIGFRMMQDLFRGVPGVTFKRGDLEAHFPSGSVVCFRSGEDPDNLAGESNVMVVIDESGRCKRDVWTILRTTLTATKGKALRIGTPKGRNWFYRGFVRGQDPLVETHASRQCQSSENPFLDPAEIAEARQEIPELMFRQEYLAEFVDDLDIVFPGFRSCLWKGEWPIDPEPRHRYQAGLDLGKSKNFTVVSIFDREGNREVFRDRWHKLPWQQTTERIVRALFRYNDADCVVDSTGVGDPVLEGLRKAAGRRVHFRGFRYTATTKRQLVENLQVMLEKGEMLLHEDPELVNEFGAFEYAYNHRTRQVTYSAPEGTHDDIVNAVALAAMGLKRRPLIPAQSGVLD